MSGYNETNIQYREKVLMQETHTTYLFDLTLFL